MAFSYRAGQDEQKSTQVKEMMPNPFSGSGREDQDGFKRQRRNLMAISLVLLVADIPNELRTTYAVLKMHPPFTVNLVLWGMWLYWLWRYYTAFHEIENKGFVDRHERRMRHLIRRTALRRLERDPALKQRLDAELKGINAVSWKYNTSYGSLKLNTEALGLLAWLGPEKNQWQELRWRPEVAVEDVPRKLAHYRAWVYVLFRTSLFSEYVFPFLLAGVTFLVGIYRWIR